MSFTGEEIHRYIDDHPQLVEGFIKAKDRDEFVIVNIMVPLILKIGKIFYGNEQALDTAWVKLARQVTCSSCGKGPIYDSDGVPIWHSAVGWGGWELHCPQCHDSNPGVTIQTDGFEYE